MNIAISLPIEAPHSAHLAPESLEGRVALQMTAHLSRSAEALPHHINERLRVARERALTAGQQQRRTAKAPAAGVVWTGAHQAALQGPPSVWLRLASALPLAVLVAGLVLIQHHREAEQIQVAAEIDSALLADELPPQAYGDPGFSEYLQAGTGP